MIDPSIIMGIRAPNIPNALAGGMALGQQAQEMQRGNALRAFMQANGAGLMQGDPNALAAYAALDPQGAMGLQSDLLGQQSARQSMAMERERLGLAREQLSLGLESTRLGMDQTRQSMQFDREGAVREAEEFARRVSAEEALAVADQIEDAMTGATAFFRNNDQEGMDRFFASRNMPSVPLAEFEAEALAEGVAVEVLRGGQAGVNRSLTPIWGTDAEGNRVPMQLGDDGTAVATALPPGITPAAGFDRVDLGSSIGIIDRATGQMAGSVPVDNQGAAYDRAVGGAQGEAAGAAITGLGGSLAEAQTTLDLIGQIRNDPALPRVTGMIQGRLGYGMAGQAGTDLGAKIEHLRSRSFLSAIDALRGMGALSNMEGQAATAAIARLETAQSTEAFQAALDELSGYIEGGMRRAQERAGQAGTTATAPPAPAAVPPATPTPAASALTVESLPSMNQADVRSAVEAMGGWNALPDDLLAAILAKEDL